MRRKKLKPSIAALLFAAINCGCSASGEQIAGANKISQSNQTESIIAAKLGVVRQSGTKIVYYKIPPAVSNDELIEIAAKLHAREPDAQMILVDDDSQATAYIRYVNETVSGVSQTKMPKEWAEKHIVANIQKHVNGKFVLCLGRGFQEIAELE